MIFNNIKLESQSNEKLLFLKQALFYPLHIFSKKKKECTEFYVGMHLYSTNFFFNLYKHTI